MSASTCEAESLQGIETAHTPLSSHTAPEDLLDPISFELMRDPVFTGTSVASQYTCVTATTIVADTNEPLARDPSHDLAVITNHLSGRQYVRALHYRGLVPHR